MLKYLWNREVNIVEVMTSFIRMTICKMWNIIYIQQAHTFAREHMHVHIQACTVIISGFFLRV
jgi:hypothetical protein